VSNICLSFPPPLPAEVCGRVSEGNEVVSRKVQSWKETVCYFGKITKGVKRWSLMEFPLPEKVNVEGVRGGEVLCQQQLGSLCGRLCRVPTALRERVHALRTNFLLFLPEKLAVCVRLFFVFLLSLYGGGAEPLSLFGR